MKLIQKWKWWMKSSVAPSVARLLRQGLKGLPNARLNAVQLLVQGRPLASSQWALKTPFKVRFNIQSFALISYPVLSSSQVG